MYRFAPSPTGDLHIGNLRAAIFNFLRARQEGGDLILRIEDTDEARNIPGKIDEIKQILRTLSLEWDRLIIQSQNLPRHQELASQLLAQGRAFACFCTPEELAQEKEAARVAGLAYQYSGRCEHLPPEEVAKRSAQPHTIRLKRPSQAVKFTDLIKGELVFEPGSIDSFIILRENGTPTYNFACAVDDMDEGISCIIRGEDHTSNTPKQELIRQALGCTQRPSYAHLPIILNEAGAKMSKREAHSSVKWLLAQGLLPGAIVNYLILLGNKMPSEIFGLDEAGLCFELKNLSRSPAKFDLKKLLQINREHIKRTEDALLGGLLRDFAASGGEDGGGGDGGGDFLAGLDAAGLGALGKFYTQEASTLKEINERLGLIFRPKVAEDFGELTEGCQKIRAALRGLELPEDYEDFREALMSRTKLRGRGFFAPLRLLLTGQIHGPDLAQLYPLLRPFLPGLIKA